MSSNATPYETADLVARFREVIPQLPTTTCRQRQLDLEFLKRDLANERSFVSKKLSDDEKNGLLLERKRLLMRCMLTPNKPPTTPYLYQAKEGEQFVGGPWERLNKLSKKE